MSSQNDPSKTLCTTGFLMEIAQYIKIADLTAGEPKATDDTVPAMPSNAYANLALPAFTSDMGIADITSRLSDEEEEQGSNWALRSKKSRDRVRNEREVSLQSGNDVLHGRDDSNQHANAEPIRPQHHALHAIEREMPDRRRLLDPRPVS